VWLPSKVVGGGHDAEVDLETAELVGELVEEVELDGVLDDRVALRRDLLDVDGHVGGGKGRHPGQGSGCDAVGGGHRAGEFNRDVAERTERVRTSHHIDLGICANFSAANSLFKPGAIFLPSIAASMTMVPEPQSGSQNGRNGFQLLS
jgi:hypothetical protein